MATKREWAVDDGQTGCLCDLPMKLAIVRNMMPIRIATAPASHTTILGSRKINTPSTISQSAGQQEQRAGMRLLHHALASSWLSGTLPWRFDAAWRRVNSVARLVAWCFRSWFAP